jgi:hypothetical protein
MIIMMVIIMVIIVVNNNGNHNGNNSGCSSVSKVVVVIDIFAVGVVSVFGLLGLCLKVALIGTNGFLTLIR